MAHPPRQAAASVVLAAARAARAAVVAVDAAVLDADRVEAADPSKPKRAAQRAALYFL